VSAGPATAHRPGVRRPVAPRRPRRVSGPAGPRERTLPPRSAAPAQGVALPQPFAPRVLDALRDLPDARWLDRLLRGRAYIALIGLALIGLVFMQVSMLGMNAGIGRAVDRSAMLERHNADLRATVSRLSSEERIQREALKMGLVMPPAGEVRYVSSRGAEADARRAVRIMRAPSDPADPAALAALPTAGSSTIAPEQPQAVQPAAAAVAPAPVAEPETAPTEPVGATAEPQAGAQVAPQAAPAPEPEAETPQAEAAAATGAAAAPGSGG
jgi:hypothetical protein